MDPLELPTQELRDKELNETPERRAEGIPALRKAFAKQHADLVPHVPLLEDDAFLLRFLRCAKFNLERAVERLRNYGKFRHDHPDLLRPPTAAQLRAQLIDQPILPHRSTAGCLVTTLYAGRVDFVKMSYRDMLRCNGFIMEKLLADPATQVNGIMVLQDFTGMSLMKMNQVNSNDQRVGMHWMQDCLPVRMKGMHSINAPWYISLLMAIVRPFLSSKMMGRITLYGRDLRELHRLVAPEHLPAEFGGTLGAFDPLAPFAVELAALEQQ